MTDAAAASALQEKVKALRAAGAKEVIAPMQTPWTEKELAERTL